MQAQNYTNPADRGRFGFSMSGEYRAPYKGESLIVTMLVGLAVVAAAILFFIVRQIVQRDKDVQDGASFFVGVGGAIALIIFVIILIMIFGVGIRNVKKGFKCQYSANDATFTATIGGDLHVIKYSEVTSVTFEPRMTFGKIRGYDVTVRVNGVNERFSVCSDGYMSERATPFYIIQERLDILRQPQQGSGYINNAHANTRGITRAETDLAQSGSISAMDRMARLLGETSDMPELKAGGSPSQQAVARMNQMMNSYGQADMPAVGQPMPLSASNVYVGADGRERALDDVLSQGVFYIKPKFGIVLTLTLIIMALSALVVVAALTVIFSFVINWGSADTIITIAAAVLIQPIVIYKTVMQTHGKSYSYKADGRGFFVTSGKNDDNYQILYKEVMSVDYTPYKLFGKVRGYNVDILTNCGIVHYDYIFPSYSHPIPRQYLPFEVIRQNMPQSESK